ncbi:MAG: FAD binding domain-containing protein [Anaerolineales bacterium]|nr:FAD binding domain-containing protein [Anaerolineales bacterium]
MPLWKHYHLPTTVSEALAQLRAYGGEARVVAGGTDLLLELQQGRKPPVAALVDITRISEMTIIREADGYLYLGAGVTHTSITNSPILISHATCLVESCGVIGGPQVRNVATIGGNVAHALPAGDGTLSLVALEAEAEIAKTDDGSPDAVIRQWRPIQSLFKGPGKSAVDQSRELIVQFRFRPTGPGEATAFKRIMRPQGVALPILGLAVWVRARGDRIENAVIENARLALGPAGPAPLRAAQAEAFLRGKPFTAELLPAVAEMILKDARLRTSPHRATAEYRRELILPLVERALTLAVNRAVTGVVEPEGVDEG